jgi:hypothetical protein
MPDRSAAHTALLRDIRLALGREPDLVLWQVNQGHGEDKEGRHFAQGMVRGASDLIGILDFEAVRRNLDCGGYLQRYRVGRFISLEAKTGKATLSKDQQAFRSCVQRYGGFHAVVHSVEEARAAVERARRGET